MKIYLTEAGAATTSQATCTGGFRRPLKLLQNFQFFHISSNMSSKVSISSSLKTSTSRQKTIESKESQTKNKPLTFTSRQASTRNSNCRNSYKNPHSYKKQEGENNLKAKKSESSDGSVTSVGSLTSSPKWSHIKNKFESGESTLNSKTNKTSSMSESKKSVQSNKTTKSTSTNVENCSYIHRNKYLTARKDSHVNKSENSLSSSPKNLTERSRITSSTKNETQKFRSRCASPRNITANIPLANSSALHCSTSLKKVTGSINSIKNSQSSNSVSPEGSVRSSRCSSPSTLSNSSTTSKTCPSKKSSNIPIDNSVNNLLRSSLDTSKNCSNVSKNSSSISNLNLSHISKRNLHDSKISSSSRIKQNCEDKPILSFNQVLSQRDKSEAIAENKTIKKSLGSDLEKSLSSSALSSNKASNKVPKTRPNSVINILSNKTLILETAEKINDLAKNSQTGPKTVWVKDTAGNWIKKGNAESKTINSSKVASLRSKFMEPSKEGNIPITKSSTTPSVPSKHVQNSRPLAKSSTTSNISDKVFLNDFTKKPITSVDKVDKGLSIESEVTENSIDKKESQCANEDNNLKLSIVQRAVLSYEGNIALLSPETQRRLKLVSEKVKAQTDDDKILQAKTKSNAHSSFKNSSEKRADVNGIKRADANGIKRADANGIKRADANGIKRADANSIKRADANSIKRADANSIKRADVNSIKHSSNVLKGSNVQHSLEEPVLPVLNFLNRYQQMNKALSSKEQSKTPINKDSKTSINKDSKTPINKDSKTKQNTKQSETRSTFTDISLNTLNKKETTDSKVINNFGDVSQKTDSQASSKSVTKLTMNFKLPNGELDLKSHNEENPYELQPNSSFLWRRSHKAPSEVSKSSTASSVSLTSSDYRNYYDIENYYSTLELEIDKGSENSEEHIYIDSQESNNSSENNYASSTYGPYQNVLPGKLPNGSHDEWTDISDDDYRKNSVSSNQSSTLKRRRNKRHSSHRESSPNSTKSQNEQRKQLMNDTISFTDSSDTLINDEIGNESACDLSDINHLYEPVYESLGNYLRNHDEENDENCSISLSPEEQENGDFMHCSLTSLESAESGHQEKDRASTSSKTADDKNTENKKGGNKISQLKRHLSWTKNDIRLELSSKFNKIKIKKNGRNSTEIGLKMQDSENINTSPKKKTFIKCILRQKSAGSIPLKRSPSPKKESALFYVHLTMGREKQRPFSDSVVAVESSKNSDKKLQNTRKQSDSALTFTTDVKCNQQYPRSRKFGSGHTIQRPKTPPPLPPVQSLINNKASGTESEKNCTSSTTTLVCETNDLDSQFYSVLDSEYISTVDQKQLHPYENEVLKLIHAEGKNRASNSTSVEDTLDGNDAPSDRGSRAESRNLSCDLNLPLFQEFQTEHLKSPFEEEPMYQFYQKDVQQRATLWYSVDGSESEFEDDISSKLSDPDYQSLKRPVLQSQMSAMDLVHGEGGQRRLWCEVPEVVESGILKDITSNDRKIQEAMFEVITSEASYLKSLNFLIEHFVQCIEFSGDYTEKHVLDKRERHILFSDIQPVRDVSASLLADLEKRWLKYIVLSDICDILYYHASRYFSVYVKYCSNQLYQERLLRELKEKRPEFVTVLKRLESNAVCQGLDMRSFLMLPMQRITRLPLLIDAIFRRLSVDAPIYESCKIALATVNKIVAECNEGACKMQRMEEMLVISQQIDFKACKGLGLLSASRWLVKKGELVQLLMDNASRRTFGRSSRWCKIQLYLFLFTDLLVVTRKKSDDSYSVIDYCPRNMLQVMPMDENIPPLPLRLPSSYRNVFQLIMLNNRDGKTVEMLLSCLLESDRTRWMSAVRPAKSENPDEKIYEEWDCPQVQCTHAYNAQQPDELSLEEADVVNVFKKMSDGWFEGERIRDGIRGWFPSSHAVEIINSHVRARNLHQRYRLLMLSQTYVEEQYKAQVLQNKK